MSSTDFRMRTRQAVIALIMFAGLVPTTAAFADSSTSTSTVTLTITAAPVVRTSRDWAYDPAVEAMTLVATTSMIAQLP